MTSKVLIKLIDIGKAYHERGSDKWILKNITFDVKNEEITSIIGPSGCGKTTLLRIMANLETPSKGMLNIYAVASPKNDFLSMVFQDFALIPWLTVYENIEIALDHLDLTKKERAERISNYLEMVGMSGYEDAYISELSRGLKQKVGLARALSVEPTVLLMDEPFSTIDPLSAQALREELVKLWEDPDFPTDSIVLTSHNIEEAVFLSDRVIVLSEKPSTIKGIINIDLPRPRNPKGKAFNEYVDEIYSILVT